tara:strand:+ start:282 stop:410 length:129 start_codon:yes stop_codon:yes gene_type:complete
MNTNYKGEKMKNAFKLLKSFNELWYGKPPRKKRKYKKRKTSK